MALVPFSPQPTLTHQKTLTGLVAGPTLGRSGSLTLIPVPTRHQQAILGKGAKWAPAFDGVWDVGVVSGGRFRWHSGEEAQLLFNSPTKMQMSYNGTLTAAELQANGEIHWEDGDVWTRKQELPARGKPSTIALTESPVTQKFIIPQRGVQAVTASESSGSRRPDSRSMPFRLDKALRRNCPWPEAKGLKSLKKLSMVREGLRPSDIQALPLVFRHTPVIQALDLSWNDVGPGWVQVITEAVIATCNEFDQTEFAVLELQWCGITEMSGLKKALEYTNNTGSSGFKALHLGANKLGPTSMVDLLAVAKELPKLTSLILEKNPIGPQGAFSLSHTLRFTRELTVLLLGECCIGPDGAAELAEGLTHTRELKELGLQCNRIGPGGAEALRHAFPQLVGLVSLDLSWNSLGKDGMQSVAKGLLNCRKLDRLLLGGNGLDPSAERELMIGMKHISSGLLDPPRS